MFLSWFIWVLTMMKAPEEQKDPQLEQNEKTPLEDGLEPRRGASVGDSPRDVKNVFIYKNGDPFYRPHRFIVNSKQIRNYEAFLSQVTSTIKPRFGCVRKLHTPDHGRRVVDLDNLEQGKYYVAAGMETFAKMPYRTISEKQQKVQPQHKEVKPVYHSRLQVSAKITKGRRTPITIFVFENGNELKSSSRVLITPREQETWEQVMGAVSEKVILSTKGAVRWLYTMSGQRVHDPSGLKNNESYVASSGDGKFQNVNYGANKRPLYASPKLDRKKNVTARAGQQKKVSTTDSNTNISQTPNDDVFKKGRSRPQRTHVRRAPDDEETGPFKSSGRNGHSRGAREVEDGEETKVELPIDQVEAEEVQDDDTEQYNKPINKRGKTPEIFVSKEESKSPDKLEQAKQTQKVNNNESSKMKDAIIENSEEKIAEQFYDNDQMDRVSMKGDAIQNGRASSQSHKSFVETSLKPIPSSEELGKGENEENTHPAKIILNNV